MKKGLIVSLAVLIVGIGGASLYASGYNDGDETSSETDVVESTITVEVDDQKDTPDIDESVEDSFAMIETRTAEDEIDSGNVLYYFYQPNCSHCQAIKSDIVDFYENKPEDIKFYAVDLTEDINQDIWSADTSNEVGDSIETIGDFKVLGTPTMVQMNDGEVTAVSVGTDEVLSLLAAN